MVSEVDDQDGRVGGGEGVEYGNVRPPSDSGSQSSKGSWVGLDASMPVSVGFSRMTKDSIGSHRQSSLIA